MDKKKLKVAFINITQNLVNRGAETFVKELAVRLDSDYQVTVLSGKSTPARRWPILWRIYLDLNGLSVLWFTVKLLPKVWKEKFNVVIPVNGGWQSVLVRIITWLYGGKMIISGQSGKGWDDRVNLWAFPDLFVSLSTSLERWAKVVNPFVRITHIPNGVDLKKFSSAGAKLDLNLEKPIILCVGALTEEKRIELVIRSAAGLSKGSLLVVGDGPLKDHLVSLGGRILGRRFSIITMPFADMPKVYKAADVFTLPSPSYRSFEIVIVEAMATNLPVVVNDDPIRREIVDGAGLFVNPQDIKSYTSALRTALKTEWGNKPKDQAKKFSWEEITLNYKKAIDKLFA